MRIVVAMDSFKGSLTSVQAGNAVKEGVLRVYPEAEISVLPVADGGEGTVDALVQGLGGRRKTVLCTGPSGRKIRAQYGVVGDTAIIEASAAAGITLLSDEEKNPMVTTSYGVGELILDAVKGGCTRVIIGIGGSATNDGGAGMLQALGFGLHQKSGAPIGYGAEGLKDLSYITSDSVDKGIRTCRISVACDVKNPLCGAEGCSAVYAPQKGAKPSDIPLMDGYLAHFAQVVKAHFPLADANARGAGAAGGMGFALASLLQAELISGIDLIMQLIAIEDAVKNADIVITGEGRIDVQTAMGKVPVGIARLAKKHGKPVIAFAGSVAKGAELCHAEGIDAVFPAVRGVTSLAEAMERENAENSLAGAAEQAFRLWRVSSAH